MPRISSPVKPKAAKRLSMEDKAPKSPTRSGSSGRKVATPSKKAPSTPTRKKTPKTPVVTPTTPRYRKKPAAEEDFSSDSDSENVSDASNNPQRLSKKFLDDIPDPEDIEKSVKELKDTAIPLNATKKVREMTPRGYGFLSSSTDPFLRLPMPTHVSPRRRTPSFISSPDLLVAMVQEARSMER